MYFKIGKTDNIVQFRIFRKRKPPDTEFCKPCFNGLAYIKIRKTSRVELGYLVTVVHFRIMQKPPVAEYGKFDISSLFMCCNIYY